MVTICLSFYLFEDNIIEAGEAAAMLWGAEHHGQALLIIIRLQAYWTVEFNLLPNETTSTDVLHKQSGNKYNPQSLIE